MQIEIFSKGDIISCIYYFFIYPGTPEINLRRCILRMIFISKLNH